MHREFHPEELRPFDAGSMSRSEADGPHGLAPLVFWCVLLGGLLLLQALLDALGAGSLVRAWPISPVRLAALLGAARMVYLALEAMLHGSVGADVALAIASVAALILGENFVAAEVVLIALVGEILEAWTAHRALRAIRATFDQTPRMAQVRRHGELVAVPPHLIHSGDVVVIAPGDRIPVDGLILAGRTSIDESALTGESVPVDRGPGETVYSGTINQNGQVEVRADRVGTETTIGQVQRLVAEAQARKSSLERTADRLARWFLPFVLAAAGLTVLAGSVLGWPDAWSRAVAILVVACPCALILATPAAIMASLAWLARNGIVLKSGAALERLASCNVLALDKTGTLTLGRPELSRVITRNNTNQESLIRIAASAEQGSRHPLAIALVEAARRRGLDLLPVTEVSALPGAGIAATLSSDSTAVLVGNLALLQERGIPIPPDLDSLLDELDQAGDTALLVTRDLELIGILGLRDTVRPEAFDVIHELHHLGFHETTILTGDRPLPALAIAHRVHVENVEAQLRPDQKAAWVEARQRDHARVLFVGDGINDAPALAAADVGVAIGRTGSDLAAEAGDVVMLGEPLVRLPDLVRLSRATVSILRQNIIGFAFGLNGVAIALAALGWLGPVPAAILHQAGSVLVILNSMRLLGFGRWSRASVSRWAHEASHALEHWDERFDLGPFFGWFACHSRSLTAALLLTLPIGYLFSGFTRIGPNEVGLIRRLGCFDCILHPGLHWRWPAPIERLSRLRPRQVRVVTLGFRETADPAEPVGWESGHGRGIRVQDSDEALVMTGDGQLIELTAGIQYQTEPTPAGLRDFAFRAREHETALRSLAASVLRAEVGQRPLDDLLTHRRTEVELELLAQLRRKLESTSLGIRLVQVTLTDAHPPLSILDAYRDVARAGLQSQARGHQARTVAARTRAESRSTSARMRDAAESERVSLLESARAEAEAFQAEQSARASAPELADFRRALETIATALSNRDKVLIDAPPQGRRHLLLADPGSPDPMPALSHLLEPESNASTVPASRPATPSEP